MVYQTLLADATEDASNASAGSARAASLKKLTQEEWEATPQGVRSLAGKILPLARQRRAPLTPQRSQHSATKIGQLESRRPAR